MQKIILAALLVGLAACARQPIPAEQQKGVERVSALSFLGEGFVVDVSSRSLLRPKVAELDVESWKMDEAFRELLRERVGATGREFQPFALDSAALAKALGTRESRWKRSSGSQNHSLMELLFRQAEQQGIHFFFLASPLDDKENFPLNPGTMGVTCPDEKVRHQKANLYFKFEFTLWSVEKRSKVFRFVVNPEHTRALALNECTEVAAIRELGKELEDPVKVALGLVVDSLIEKLGWAKKPLR